MQDPNRFAAAVPAEAVGGVGPAAAEAAPTEAMDEPAEESDDDIGMSLFDD